MFGFLILSLRMTACTIIRVVVLNLTVLAGHIGLGVLVASKAGIGGEGAWMTGCTYGPGISVVKREVVCEIGRLPGCGGMTG